MSGKGAIKFQSIADGSGFATIQKADGSYWFAKIQDGKAISVKPTFAIWTKAQEIIEVIE